MALQVQTDDENSRRTRILPAFGWLRANAGENWATELLQLAEGITPSRDAGRVLSLECEAERAVKPSSVRLAWMIRNAHRLAPVNGRLWQEYQNRVIRNPAKEKALKRLDEGITAGIPAKLILEGATHADCLIECEHAVLWIEGKRNDWLAPAIKWDITRDQLARNLEAAWMLGSALQKDFWLVICHENDLKHHEERLIEGYRAGTWTAGLPHLQTSVREIFRTKIGTLRWETLFGRWPSARLSSAG